MMMKDETTNICREESISLEKDEHYGRAEIDRLRNSRIPYDELNAIEKFTFYNGWDYATREALQAAFMRYSKCDLLTEEEFFAEAGVQETLCAKETYQILKELAGAGVIDKKQVYWYAHYRWCIEQPEAILAYRGFSSVGWRVNHCAQKVSPEKAIVFLNHEFGFEASRIKIIGTPYYDAEDSHYIRFDCGGIFWLAQDGELFNVDMDEWRNSWQSRDFLASAASGR